MLASSPSEIARVAKVSDSTQIKILIPKQMLRRLTVIHQIICFLYRAKEIAKKLYNNIMNSVKI